MITFILNMLVKIKTIKYNYEKDNKLGKSGEKNRCSHAVLQVD